MFKKSNQIKAFSLLMVLCIMLSVFIACASEPEPPSQPEQAEITTLPVSESASESEISVFSESLIVSIDYLIGELPANHIFCDDPFLYESSEIIIITTNKTIRNFTYIEIGYRDYLNNLEFYYESIIYALEELSPETPFVATWQNSIIPSRAIVFEDENGVQRSFFIGVSGRDGSLSLEEYEFALSLE